MGQEACQESPLNSLQVTAAKNRMPDQETLVRMAETCRLLGGQTRLRVLELVTFRRQGKTVYSSLTDNHTQLVLTEISRATLLKARHS